MVALVFAAGMGTRLKPWTLEHPKALVEVGGRPMLARVLRRLEDAGARRIVVNVHHFATQIRAFLAAWHSPAEIIVSDESDELLETGGGLLKARTLLQAADSEPIIIHNADILTDVSLTAMADAHRRDRALATLLVSDRPTSRHFVTDGHNHIVGWTNVTTGEVKPSGLDISGKPLRAFDGVHVVDNAIFEPLQAYAEAHSLRRFSITPFYIDACGTYDITAYEPEGPFAWYDIGDTEKLARAQAYINAHG